MGWTSSWLAVVGAAFIALPQAQAATARVVEGTLEYEASPGEVNQLMIATEGETYELSDSGATTLAAGTGCDAITPNAVRCAAAEITRVAVSLGDLNDSATLDISVRAVINGGDGADTLAGGSGDDRLHGGASDDRLEGRLGFDDLDGGEGADVLSGGTGVTGVPSIPGHPPPELDIAVYSSRATPVNVTLDGRANDGRRREADLVSRDIEGIFGGTGDDILIGDAGRNVLAGSGGDDTIRGGGGRFDLLLGGSGDDRVSGAAFEERGEGGPGNDILLGHGGKDLLDGGSGDDRLWGGRGPDYLFGRSGADIVSGGPGRDFISIRDGAEDIAHGGPGRDAAFSDCRLDRLTSIEASCRRRFELTGRPRP